MGGEEDAFKDTSQGGTVCTAGATVSAGRYGTTYSTPQTRTTFGASHVRKKEVIELLRQRADQRIHFLTRHDACGLILRIKSGVYSTVLYVQ